MFTRKQIWMLLVPLILEQLLNSLMGMADTMMVSNVGAAAVAAVSLVDSINQLFVSFFTALGTGACVVCAQYLGMRDEVGANRVGQQVLLSTAAISLTCTVLMLALRGPIMHLTFGKVEADVMADAMVYYWITVASYPFLAVYNASAALFRAGKNARLPMTVSMLSNVLNVAGNAVLIFGFHMGAAGAAIATLASRIFCAVVVTALLRRPRQAICVRDYRKIRPDFALIRKILSIGVPTGVENSMFQFGKLAIQSTVSTLGTVAISANAITAIIEAFSSMAPMGIGLGITTIVGQCIGAGRRDLAKTYTLRLSFYAWVSLVISAVACFVLIRPISQVAGMLPEAAEQTYRMVLFVTILKPIFWTFSFMPAYGMRAAGDVRFCMLISTITMWVCRVAISIAVMRLTGLGALGVWIGMASDWAARSVIFAVRFFGGKWLRHEAVAAK